jgi:hypothetical protein
MSPIDVNIPAFKAGIDFAAGDDRLACLLVDQQTRTFIVLENIDTVRMPMIGDPYPINRIPFDLGSSQCSAKIIAPARKRMSKGRWSMDCRCG